MIGYDIRMTDPDHRNLWQNGGYVCSMQVARAWISNYFLLYYHFACWCPGTYWCQGISKHSGKLWDVIIYLWPWYKLTVHQSSIMQLLSKENYHLCPVMCIYSGKKILLLLWLSVDLKYSQDLWEFQVHLICRTDRRSCWIVSEQPCNLSSMSN